MEELDMVTALLDFLMEAGVLVYFEQPTRYDNGTRKQRVCLLIKTLYGLK